MANITLLHWNIETFGPAKYRNTNRPNFIRYIASLVNNVNADIFTMVEVKNSVSAAIATNIATDINLLQGILPVNNPWRSVIINSAFNNEAYIIMYRVDRNFAPVQLGMAGPVANALLPPDNGLATNDIYGATVQFPSRHTPRYGRRPFYATFQTTDTNHTFSVLSYHAMYGAGTAYGVRRIPSIDFVSQFEDDTAMYASLIAGDFNVDYNVDNIEYTNLLALPSYPATNQETSLQNDPIYSDDPLAYRSSAYDNIFQKVPAPVGMGNVIDLMLASAIVPAPSLPPPAAQPGVGNLSAAAGAFNIPALNHYLARIITPIAALPPGDMGSSWDFVREGISNHYPVTTTTAI